MRKKSNYKPLNPMRRLMQRLRFNPLSEHELFKLRYVPHDTLEALRLGKAVDGDFDTLACRINVGLYLARKYAPEHLDTAQAAVSALLEVLARFNRLGKWGLAGQELTAIAAGLDQVDQIEGQIPRPSLLEAFYAVVREAGTATNTNGANYASN